MEDTPTPIRPSEELGRDTTAHEEGRQVSSSETSSSTENYPAMTMEDVLQAEQDLQFHEVHRNEIVSGRVVLVSSEGIAVDVGAKVEAIIPLNQIAEEPLTLEEAQERFRPGDAIDAMVVRTDIPNGVIVLSKRRADQDRGWRLLAELQNRNQEFPIEVQDKVRGGLVASIDGIRAFLPASQVDLRRVNDLSPYVGQVLPVKLIELNRKRNRVIISHRAVLEARKAEARERTMEHLTPGAILEGEVVEITDFGVFVNLGGIDGLVHRSELTYGRFNHPRDVVKIGDRVQVQVIDLDNSRDRINLSMKALTEDPWQSSIDQYSIGQHIRGRVTNLTNFGAFVEIQPGLEGLIHISEMSWTKRIRHPNEILKEGEEVEAVILRIDTKERRISLGLRQVQEDPWSTLPDRYPPGTTVKGKVTGITDFGIFMEIEEGIEGLIHISELAHERVTEPGELFKKGDEVEAVIINIDPVEQRASLSRKRLLPYTGPARERPDAAHGRSGPGSSGRSGRRRRDGFDYDYSYAANEASSGKISTKIGDVYADLFAQFGLGSKENAGKPEPETETPEAGTEAQEAPKSAENSEE